MTGVRPANGLRLEISYLTTGESNVLAIPVRVVNGSAARVEGGLQIWSDPFVTLRVPKLYNLRTDPFERADITSNTYYDWLFDNDYMVLAGTFLVTQFLETFKEFPPRQEAASFTINHVVDKLNAFLTAGR